jgi:hypothetical protein
MIKKLYAALMLMTIFTISISAKRVEPYNSSRLFWDMTTRQTIFTNGLYARAIQLQDSRLMAVCSIGRNIAINISNDSGHTWEGQNDVFFAPDNYFYYDAEICQLKDGTIIVMYNIGPLEPYDRVRFYGVRLNISKDNGKTWSSPIDVYTAGYYPRIGCWEPSMLELPSGELQLYLSDESPYTTTTEQCIQLFRSYDKGNTWSKPEMISYRPDHRDGMPVPALVGDTIVVAIEDNGWPGADSFVPVTIRCPLETNWKGVTVGANSPSRSQVIDYNWCPKAYGGAPYLRVLPWGETVLSRQSYHESGNYDVMNMYVYVGDENARGFKSISQPFIDNAYTKISVECNSIAVIDTGIVCAFGGVGAKGPADPHVDFEYGYPIKQFKAYYGKPTIDGIIGSREYNSPGAKQITMGTNTIGFKAFSDFDYDEDYLYFCANISDRTPVRKGGTCDAVRLLLDADNVSEDTPVKGMFNFLFRVDSTYSCWQGDNGNWSDYADTTGIVYKVIENKVGYKMEVAIPWKVFGLTTMPMDKRMGMGVEIQDVDSTTMLTETMPDLKKEQSWTWMNFYLDKKSLPSAVSTVKEAKAEVAIEGNNLKISNTLPINNVTIYSIDGKIVAKYKGGRKAYDVSAIGKGLYIVTIKFANGKEDSKKIQKKI